MLTGADAETLTDLPSPPPLCDKTSLFLDFDGTLAPIMPEPDAAYLPVATAGGLDLLLQRLSGRLAIVSGRSIEQLDQLLRRRDIAVAAVHGLELRWPDGRIEETAPAPGLMLAKEALATFAAQHPGILLEDKILSLGIHFRAAPKLGELVHSYALHLAQTHGLSIQTGKMVVELRTPGRDKGAAIGRLMEMEPFRSGMPIFVGDDDTDEAGFAMVARLGGYGIRVGAAPEITAAQYGLPDVEAVASWLSGKGHS